uniref:Transketolase subunit A n=1 Tax=Candidatus Kentrum sp. MB TaxID=2138164 RepID=A0A450X6V6_9GAMM|nr:MAG: transketolase subunit A [Candidatus Kentron sp. MB]VFK35437.1 MAG: transketolase subunit A [Candidatus Kentron sp. MB]VFK77297.1 MAG: transketolase subunit A [Candidatus Kentron sp. MB]
MNRKPFSKHIHDPHQLEKIARELRKAILQMIHHAGSGHVGGSLSCIDILTCLYFGEMRHYPFRADWPARDRFVLSKGHAAPALYAILARSGYIANHDLFQLRRLDSILQGHPDSRRCPGVEASSGSLGQGLSIAHGIALAIRDEPASPRVYVLLGDGELQEGQVWEAAMSAGHYRTHNLCALVDANGLQLDGAVRDIKNIEPISDKFTAFGWNAIDINGHNMQDILQALEQARAHREGPTVIVARTVKGKGVSFIENKAAWHGKTPNDEQLRVALEELDIADKQ